MTPGEIVLMRMLDIAVWHHPEDNHWSVRVNGVLHHHVSGEVADDLLELALISAEQEAIGANTEEPPSAIPSPQYDCC